MYYSKLSYMQGDYVRIFPTPDPVKAQLYTALMEEASQLSILGERERKRKRESVCV